MNAPTWLRRVNSRSFAGREEVWGEVQGIDGAAAGRLAEQTGVLIHSVLELLEASLVHLS